MPLRSMTGFARTDGAADGLRWVWELRSVNGKGLDVRARLAPGFEALEVDIKPLLGQQLSRGSVSVALTVREESASALPQVNAAALDRYVQLATRLSAETGLAPPTLGELLSLRGVIDSGGDMLDEEAQATRRRRLLPSLDAAIAKLQQARAEEGERLCAVIHGLLEQISAKVDAAASLADSQAPQQRDKLMARLADLLGPDARLDKDRLEQEVALLALKADVREELDRLRAHLAAAHALLAKAEPTGRAFDFLAQEFNREANTLCSKAATNELTRIGLDLKALIDQLREQVQNIE
jgi:uncharacterized protein (TIGR00255 family)